MARKNAEGGHHEPPPTADSTATAIDGLADLLRLSRELDAATQQAVGGLGGFGYSWGEIAARLGTTCQAAQQRWGRNV